MVFSCAVSENAIIFEKTIRYFPFVMV